VQGLGWTCGPCNCHEGSGGCREEAGSPWRKKEQVFKGGLRLPELFTQRRNDPDRSQEGAKSPWGSSPGDGRPQHHHCGALSA